MSQLPPSLLTLNYAPPPPGKDLRRVAVYQRNLNLCILVNVVAYGLLIYLGVEGGPLLLRGLLALFVMGVEITAAVFVFMLALQLYSIAGGIVLGILSLIPFIGLLFLLPVNSRATHVLRRNNIRVGLLGANPSQVPDGGRVI
jgi:hypothetical protein